jgi:hypothetical protein
VLHTHREGRQGEGRARRRGVARPRLRHPSQAPRADRLAVLRHVDLHLRPLPRLAPRGAATEGGRLAAGAAARLRRLCSHPACDRRPLPGGHHLIDGALPADWRHARPWRLPAARSTGRRGRRSLVWSWGPWRHLLPAAHGHRRNLTHRLSPSTLHPNPLSPFHLLPPFHLLSPFHPWCLYHPWRLYHPARPLVVLLLTAHLLTAHLLTAHVLTAHLLTAHVLTAHLLTARA